MVGNTTGQLSPRKESARFVGAGLFGPSTNSLFSKSIKSSTFHIFLNLTYPFRKKKTISQNSQKSPKNLQKNYQTVVNETSRGTYRCVTEILTAFTRLATT